MQFTRQEMKAIFKLAIVMMNADGRSDDRELSLIAKEMHSFGIDGETFRQLASEAEKMDGEETVRIIKAMDSNQKKYVSGYLLAISVIDEDVHDDEVKVWRAFTDLCSLPGVTPEEALNYWKNN